MEQQMKHSPDPDLVLALQPSSSRTLLQRLVHFACSSRVVVILAEPRSHRLGSFWSNLQLQTCMPKAGQRSAAGVVDLRS